MRHASPDLISLPIGIWFCLPFVLTTAIPLSRTSKFLVVPSVPARRTRDWSPLNRTNAESDDTKSCWSVNSSNFCLSSLWRVYEKQGTKSRSEHRTKSQLAAELVNQIAGWFPTRKIQVIGDCAYVGKHLLQV